MVREGDTQGPDGLSFFNGKANYIGDKILFPISIALYGIAAAMSIVLLILALVNKPRRFIFISLPVLIGVFFEFFGWHRRAYIHGVDDFGYTVTLVLIVLLFAFAGSLMTKGWKKRIICAVAAPAIWGILYSLAFLLSNTFLAGSPSFNIAAAYILTGIEAVVILAITIKNLTRK